MKIIPVIDLLDGNVVHAKAGERASYQPIQSQISKSARPADVARGFRALDYALAYVADLNALQGGPADLDALAEIGQSLSDIIWDRGVSDTLQAEDALQAAEKIPSISGVVLALESINNRSDLDQFVRIIGAERSVFSLDLRGGQLLAKQWPSDPMAIVEVVVQLGIPRIIVLDLAQVGMEAGLSVLELCRAIHDRYPDLNIISGGGVRCKADVDLLASSGASFALVATALHKGVDLS